MSAPMFPPAAARLSITTGWPESSVSFLATSRPKRSAMPPTANGTTIRIGLSGYAGACAGARVAIGNSTVPISIAIVLRMEGFLVVIRFAAAASLHLGKRIRLDLAQRGEQQFRARAFQKHRVREHAPPRACPGRAVI